MPQFILVNTWNGEGYSESNAEIIDSENLTTALAVAQERAEDACVFSKEDIRVINKDTVTYSIEDDSGAYHVVPFEDQFGICIYPDTNQFQIIGSVLGYKRALELSVKEAELPKDSPEIQEVLEEESGCIFTSKGCEIFQKLNSNDDLEFFDGGDGVEYEIWQNKITKQNFRVPIEIVRDFANMEATQNEC